MAMLPIKTATSASAVGRCLPMSSGNVSLGDAIYGLFPDEDADSVKEVREVRGRE